MKYLLRMTLKQRHKFGILRHFCDSSTLDVSSQSLLHPLCFCLYVDFILRCMYYSPCLYADAFVSLIVT